MTPNDRPEFSAIMDDVFAAFDREPLPGAKDKFWDVLYRFRLPIVRRAFDGWIAVHEKLPTPAAVKRLAFDLAQQAAEPDSAPPQCDATPWLPLCWSTSIGVGATNPDVTYATPQPPSAIEWRKFIESVARRLRNHYGDDDRNHSESSAIRRHVAKLIRDRAEELGWTCRPRPQFAAMLEGGRDRAGSERSAL